MDAADAAVDAAVPIGSHSHYVVNRIILPTNQNAARADGFDLDNNGSVDNQLGAVWSAFLSQAVIDVQPPTDTSIANGDSITLADLQATDFTTAANAGFTLYAGTNPNPMPCNGSNDTTCGHHLTGSGSFDVAATPRDTPIIGSITNSVYRSGPGHLSVPIYVLTETTPPIVTLLGARVKFTASANGLIQGTIGGAITTADRDDKIYPSMAQGFTALVARDCANLANPPGCGCQQGSTGAKLIAYFDRNHDCALPVAEIQQNSLMMSLLQPDVLVEGQGALSVGFAFTAVDATFAP